MPEPKFRHGADNQQAAPDRPYIYTDDQIAEIVAEAARLPSSYGLRGWTCSTLFGLIAVTGLRVNEALALDEEDVGLGKGC